MGIRGHLREIPAEKFSELKAGGTMDSQALAESPYTFLDKSWYELHLLFKNTQPPLKHAISGDWQYPSSSSTMEAFVEGKGTDYYFAFVSPALVQEIATALSALSESEFISIATEVDITFDDYFRGCLAALKQAYSHAAKNGNALSITIA